MEASVRNWGQVEGRVVDRMVSEGILVVEEELDFESEAESAEAAKVSRKGAAVLALVASVRPL